MKRQLSEGLPNPPGRFDMLKGLWWDDIPIISIDTETTGLSREDKVVELSCLMFRGDKVIDEFTTLIGGYWVSDTITELTGITNDMLADAPHWEEVEERALDFLCRGAPLVAHNMSFDARMLRGMFGKKWPDLIPTICTKILSRSVLRSQGLKNFKLGNLCEAMGIELNGWHRARADAFATGQLARKLTEGRRFHECLTRSSEEWS